MDRIFIESNEHLGLLYDRYCKLPEKISSLLDELEKILYEINNKSVDSVKDKASDLKSYINKFKSEVDINMSNPDPIDVHNIAKMRKMINTTKNETEKHLNKLSKLKKTSKFGTNWIKGILFKRKGYKNTIDPEKEENVNSILRELFRGMDWAEKTILDVMNLADQDLNLLSIVSKVYYRIFFEYNDFDNILDSCIDDNYESMIMLSESSISKDIERDDDIDILDQIIQNHNDEEYFPVFTIVASYDKDKYDNLSDDQKLMITRSKLISGITLGDQYTHTIVSFDTSMENMFHFMGNGFGYDSILTNPDYEITKSIYVSVVFVTKEERDVILNEIRDYRDNHDKTAYDLMQLINQLFGKSNHKDKRQICSTFIGYLLAKANPKNLHRDYSLIRPEDITILPRAFYVMSFKDRDDFIKNKEEFKRRVDQIYNDNIDEIREYNNILPKVILKDQLKKAGSLDNLISSFAKRL